MMLARIARAFVSDLADVNGIAQQRVESATFFLPTILRLLLPATELA